MRSFQDAQSELFLYHATQAQKLEFFAQITHLNNILTQRQLPSQKIQFADYATVLEIFKRLNQQGAPLSEAQLTLAGISRHWPGVFRRTYDTLKRLNDEVGYNEAEDPTFVFQVWTGVHTAQHLVRHLAPEDAKSRYFKFANAMDYERSGAKVADGLGKLIKIMREDLDLTSFKFIKAEYPLIVVANYLATHPNASADDLDKLKRWVVLSLVAGRYHERAQSKFGADIKATVEGLPIDRLFLHRREPLNPFVVQDQLLSLDSLIVASFRSAYVTLLYLVARKLSATDWMEQQYRVGEPLPEGTWHFHHIFPDATFANERILLDQRYEKAQEEGDEAEMRRVKDDREDLEAKVGSIGNLAFLTPRTNISINHRAPADYLRELSSTHEGHARLEAQLIPMDPGLWQHASFDDFRRRRCELLAARARELFFPAPQ